MTEDERKLKRRVVATAGAFAAGSALAGFTLTAVFVGVVPAIYFVLGMELGAGVLVAVRWWLRRKVGS